MNEHRDPRTRGDYERLTGRTDWDEFRKLSDWQRIKILRHPPAADEGELHVERNPAGAGGRGVAGDPRWHWWITAPGGRVMHDGYGTSVQASDREGRTWAAKHSVHLT